jgi:hypothetical protein
MNNRNYNFGLYILAIGLICLLMSNILKNEPTKVEKPCVEYELRSSTGVKYDLLMCPDGKTIVNGKRLDIPQ